MIVAFSMTFKKASSVVIG